MNLQTTNRIVSWACGAAALSTPWRRLAAGIGAVAAAALIAACGGGGGDFAGVGTGGTGSFGVGTVSGFGSVYVNGVRYQDQGAKLVDDDGKVSIAGTDPNPLRVGMVVQVNGSSEASGASRTATQIAYGAEVEGTVSAVDAAAGTFDVLGVRVRTTPSTVYEDFGGVAALAVGQVVEVSGLPDNAGRIVATHVEREADSEAAYAAAGGKFRLRGPVAGLSGTAAAYSFSLRGLPIRTDGATQITGTPAEGAMVSVRLNPLRGGDGRYLAERLTLRSASFDAVPADANGEIEGYVSAYDAAAGTLRVGGYAVRLASGVVFEDGTAADLKNGIRVEAKGRVEGAVLLASKIEIESRDDDGDGDDSELAGAPGRVEFEGTASCIACGSGSGSFVIKANTVRYDAATVFKDGLSGAALHGKSVEVKAVPEAGASGTVYRATEIEIDD